MAANSFSVGELCFAKVKGYPAWPAEVTVVNGGKYDIFFFGTHEVGKLSGKDLYKVSEQNIAKFINSKLMGRKWYKEGLDEMKLLLKKVGPTPALVKTVVTSAKTVAKTNPKLVTTIKANGTDKDPILSSVGLLDSKPNETEKVTNAPHKEPEKSTPSPSKESQRQPLSTFKEPETIAPVPSGVSEKLVPSPMKDSEHPTSEEPVSDFLNFMDTCKRAMPTVSTPSEPVEKADTVGAKTQEKPEKVTKKGSKRQPEQPNNPSKKQKTSDPIKMNINISIEMSPETFLRVARELPGLLNMTAANTDIGVNIEN